MIDDRQQETDGLTAGLSVRVYVNERGVSVAPGATALDAVALHSSEQADEIARGASRLTDSRGLPVDASTVVHGGLILRVLPVRERTVDGSIE